MCGQSACAPIIANVIPVAVRPFRYVVAKILTMEGAIPILHLKPDKADDDDEAAMRISGWINSKRGLTMYDVTNRNAAWVNESYQKGG